MKNVGSESKYYAIATILLFLFVAWLFSGSIPVSIAVTALSVISAIFVLHVYAIRAVSRDKAVITEVSQHLVDEDAIQPDGELTSLGFTASGRVFNLATRHASIEITVFEHSRYKEVVGSILRMETPFETKTFFTFGTYLKNRPGELSTHQTHLSLYLPIAGGNFRQVFPDADVKALFEHHIEAVRYLNEKGVGTEPARIDDFVSDYEKAESEHHQRIRSSLIRSTLIYMWRSFTKRTPYAGPIADQRAAQEQIRYLQLTTRG